MHRYRTHTCGELREADVGKTARVSGWVHRKRDHGNLLFIDLRDHYGLTQCVVETGAAPFAAAEAVRHESVLTVTGPVVARDADTVNPRLPTGRVEVRINSPGGDVDAGSAIYQMLRERADLSVIVEGIAASAASIVMLASENRTIAETGRVMIHRAWSVVAGNAEELSKYAELLGKIDRTMAGIYGRVMEIDEDEALDLMSDETWYTAAEAVEAGLATAIAEGRDPEKHEDAGGEMQALASRGRRARANRILRRMAA